MLEEETFVEAIAKLRKYKLWQSFLGFKERVNGSIQGGRIEIVLNTIA